MDLCTYSPQISPGNSNINPPPAIGPVLVWSGTITLTYPYVSPTSTLVLRAPDPGNKETLGLNRINRKTRGDTLLILNDPAWPTNHIHNFVISGLTYDEVVAIQDFVKLSIGKDIGLLDYESIQWRGLIMNPNTIITETSRNCNYSAEFTFRGVMV